MAEDQDTMRPEYDFSRGRRGVTAQRYAQGANVVVIAPEVLDVFPDGAAVNDARFGRDILPTGRSCRSCARQRLWRAAERRGRHGHHGLLHFQRVPHPRGGQASDRSARSRARRPLCAELEGRVNLSHGRIEKTILLLSIESPAPIAKQGTKWQLTAATLAEEFWERTERLTGLRHEEQRQMQDYARLESGHMEFLIRALDGDPASVRPPDLPPLPTEVEPGILQEALTFLRRTSLPIQPRLQWPPGGMPQLNVRGRIPSAHRAEAGKALSIWGDAGWGSLVRRGKYQGRFADDLVHACTELMAQWAPQPAPEWVACIPSRRHPALVPDFAKRLAEQMGLPFHASLSKVEDTPEQKSMANGVHQARNVDGSLAVSLPLPAGPVLLVDDMVDSRWTFTVVAWLLRSNGSGDVWPLALALAGRAR